MNLDLIEEIRTYLRSGDHHLAVRRMLDLSFETKDPGIMQSAMEWSRLYNNYTKQNMTANLPATFFETAEEILNRSAGVLISVAPENVLLIAAHQVSKTYERGNFSLKPIDINVHRGEVKGIVGENGNGKTTLLRCLAGQLSINNGKIEYPLINNGDYYDIKNYVVFIPQRIPKWYGRLKDNLHFSAAIAGVHGSQNELMVDFMLERLGLASFAELTWEQISSGYRTRFEIARVLLQNPRLMILDEPLANLDINAQQTILTDLRFLAKSSQRPLGILLSSQQLHEVEKVADEVIFIRNGTAIYQNRTVTNEQVQRYVVELETTAPREAVTAILQDRNADIKFNGGFYTISSISSPAQEIVETLMRAGIPITYFRDITHSTKRFF